MTDYPKLIYIYWDEPSIPVSLTGKAPDIQENVGSTPTQETKQSYD
jgi:hypothetical protein